LKTLDRYLLAQISRPMIITIVVALLALLAERTLRVVDLVVGWQGSLFIIIEMLGYLIPHYLGLAMPVAFFLGIMIVFGRLSREGEIDAMMAAGAGMQKLVRPLVLSALILAVFEAALVSHLQPYSRYGYRAAAHAVTSASFHRLLNAGVFTTLGRTTYMMEDLSEDKSELRRVFLFSKQDGGESVVVTAERGHVLPPTDASPLILQLENGVNQILPSQANSDGAGENNMPAALTLRFREFETDLSGGNPKPFRPRGEDEREYTMPELAAFIGNPPDHVKAHEIDAEFFGRLAQIMSIPVLPFLALPLAIERRRMHRSSGMIIGLAILIAYNQVIQFGETMVDDGEVGALVGIGIPYLVFVLIACWIFFKATWRVPDTGGIWLDRLIDKVQAVFRAWMEAGRARS
jgi:lipopolysaccharide export system permease protein